MAHVILHLTLRQRKVTADCAGKAKIRKTGFLAVGEACKSQIMSSKVKINRFALDYQQMGHLLLHLRYSNAGELQVGMRDDRLKMQQSRIFSIENYRWNER